MLGWMDEMTLEGVGGVPLRSAACCPAMAPMTNPSRRELDASLFAPWSPVQEVSPIA